MQKIGWGLIVFLAVLALIVLMGLALLANAFITPGMALGDKIAVIPIKGEITMEEPSAFEAGLSTTEILEALKKADEDPLTGAIVLEINSPGGSIVASKQINQALQKIKKPKLAYISEEGASAGYYVASAADEIMADADSLTGSLGVIALLPNLQGLMEKLGVKMTVVKEGQFKTMGAWFEDLKPEEKALLQAILKQAFEGFKQDILKNRQGKIDAKKLEGIADGRILSGRQALELGLIDSLGTKQDAIDRAAKLAGIEFPVVEDYARKEVSLLQLLTQAGASFGSGFKQGLTAETQSQGLQS
jgi:protease-4